MAVCPGKVVVITSGRGIKYWDNTFDVYLNNTNIGRLNGGYLQGEVFIGTLDPNILLPNNHPPVFIECPVTIFQRFDDSIINIGSNTINLISDAVTNSGASGTFKITIYDLLGNTLVNPIHVATLGWAGGPGGDPTLIFNVSCGTFPPDPLSTTTTGPNPPPLTAYPCVCCCVEDDYIKLLPEKLIFTIPTTIISNSYSLGSVYIDDVTPLSYSIMTTTMIPTTTIQPSSTTIIPSNTSIKKQCKCGEVGCNALKF